MKKNLKNPYVVASLAVLILILTNLITGYLVYSKKEREYNGLKQSIQATIDQKVQMGQQLDAYKAACPDVVIDE